MACNPPREDPQTLFNRALQMFSNTVLGGAEVVPESNEWYAVSVNYAMMEQFYATANAAWQSRDPREACCEDLVAMADMDGVYPRPAIPSQGYVKLTGTAGAPLPSRMDFTVGGQTVTAISAPAVIQPDGTALVRVKAVNPGASSNVQSATGSLVQAVANVNRTVEICGGTFCQGQDAETCEQFRARYLRRLQYSPRATNQWVMDKLLEWPCATRAIQRSGACCECDDTGCGCKDCGGSLQFYVMFDGSFPCGVAPESVTQEIETWMFGTPQGYGLGQLPVGICGRIVPVQTVEVDIYVDATTCLTASQLATISDTITEYFTTVAPSQIVRATTLQAIVAGIAGIDVDVSVSFALVNEADGYGPAAATKQRTDNSKVYLGGCDMEPECDVMPCLRSVIVSNTSVQGAC